ncbi:UDP-N-acetylmuramate dehydrogenase [Ferrithrix thermotolerans DSM 19514]|uniref:UDP-N-acetylenolpyruvoylglucosamine reductase n=1 Tax=Ferrithrix thermotolerans DSM 19514 TaxID=1121881 RepID=A0A1M4TSM9_9ACTN|nr:UDP-N-acetylmuramate dehydrogenase [Ferrithrix thermotolerans]SHE47395.1 UDP-N-acetylmuramate dehydrogenase [Ferrithrix thermotolerans DSM 19514]
MSRWTEDLYDLLGKQVSVQAEFGALTTYRVGGRAKALAKITDVDSLYLLSDYLMGCRGEFPVMVLGNGSNMLISDAGFDGLVVKLEGDFDEITLHKDTTTIRLGAAALLPVSARKAAAASLSGFEWAVGVPGSVGGALRMNAGGHGSEIADCIVSATVLELGGGAKARELHRSELALGYRRSAIKDNEVVLSVDISLAKAKDPDAPKRRLAEIVRWRREHQPGGQNAGSVFVNPSGTMKAGELIERLGLKGFRIGSAYVSEKHANFIQADSGGSATDVLSVIREVKRRVFDGFGVELATEIKLIGFGEEAS